MTPSYLLHDLEGASEKTQDCILCFLERRQVARYLTGVANDGVNNVPLRQKLALRGGYCAAHSAEFAALASPLSAAILLNAFITDRLKRAANGKRPVPLRCEACEVGVKTRQSYVKSVGKNGKSPEVQKILLDGNLCLDHLELLCRRLPAGLRSALVAQRDDLLQHMAELIRKYDYRFQDETITEAEKRSIKAALSLLGSRK